MYSMEAKSDKPGLTERTFNCSLEYISTYLLTSGRGPIMLMSPLITFSNCGNSSNLNLRKRYPIFVILGSLPPTVI